MQKSFDAFTYLKSIGLNFSIVGGIDLKVRPKNKITDRSRNLIRTQKNEILDHLYLYDTTNPIPMGNPNIVAPGRDKEELTSANSTSRLVVSAAKNKSDIETPPHLKQVRGTSSALPWLWRE